MVTPDQDNAAQAKITVSMNVRTPNHKEHWTKKYKRNKAQAQAVIWHLHANRSTIWYLPCTITLTRCGPRQLDYDNLLASLKHVRDAVADFLAPGHAPGQADGLDCFTWNYAQETSKTYALKVLIM